MGPCRVGNEEILNLTISQTYSIYNVQYCTIRGNASLLREIVYILSTTLLYVMISCGNDMLSLTISAHIFLPNLYEVFPRSKHLFPKLVAIVNAHWGDD